MYTPTLPIPTSADGIPEYLSTELQALSQSFGRAQDFAYLKTLNVAPTKPREGMAAKADGTNWNPGAGAGVYLYLSGVWFPFSRGLVNLIDFGGDRTGVSDSSAAVTAAIASLPATGGAIQVTGTFKLASTVIVNKPVIFVGQGAANNGVTVGFVTSSATLDMFQISAAGVTFTDLTFTASVTRSAGYFLNFNSGVSTGNSFCRVLRCTLLQFFNGIGFTGAGAASTVRVSDAGMFTTIVGGTGINVNQTANSADVVFRDVFIVGPPSGAQMANGVQVANIGDLTLSHVSTVHAGIGLNLVPANGQTVQIVTISDSFFDSGTSYGIQTNPAAGGTVQLLKVSNTWACTNAHGIILNPSNTGATQRTEIVNCTLSNNASGAGLYIGGSTVTNTQMLGGSAAANSQGVQVIAGTTKFNIDGVRAGPSGQFGANTNYGILLAAGATNDFTVTRCDVSGNGVGGITDGSSGATKYISQNRGYNPIANTAITVTGSPFTYTNATGDTVNTYVTGGTVSSVTVDGKQVAAATNMVAPVPQGKAMVVTYTVAPTMSYTGH